MNLETPLESIKGVGPKTAVQLRDAGLNTVADLIYFLPRKHEDFSTVIPISALKPGKVSVRGHFEDVRSRYVTRRMSVVEATLVDGTSKVPVVWFNQPYRAEQIKKTHEWLVSGEFGLQRQKYQITNPSCEAVSDLPVSGGRIVPVYRAVHGLKSQLVRKILLELRPVIAMLPDTLPPELIKREKLASHADALLGLHFPSSDQELKQARERLAFEELMALLLAALMNKQANASLTSWKIPFDESAAKDFVTQLPFKLTNAQRMATWEIIKNFETGEPMNRLLQGDVGSGKTVVAGMAAYMAARAGYQTAFMAPTELLATQHGETLTRLLKPFGLGIALLTGSTKQSQRKLLLPRIENGEIQVVVGTHALFQEKVQFNKLGFVVIDEQHRFGVEQRQRLLQKGQLMPHLLAMTATPIPRSLQLTVYGELDISLLLERPAGRKPIETQIISPNSRARMYETVDEQIARGRQVYVVCPLISEGESELKSVETELKLLRSGPFKHRRIGLLHGQLNPQDKQSVMQDFVAGNLDILVSTTVVEVGVDVPNATVMIIEGADRFGLAQLHQLRGRVGRSDFQSYCYLVPTTSQKPSMRLREMERSNDGFYLAEKDLELRGPGEIYGRAQHGQLNLAIANITDTQLLKRVRASAEWMLDRGIDLVQYEQLLKEVERYRRLTTLN
jgi:ATP-dependent DNA helicase RecG